MLENSIGTTKKLVANMLNFYGAPRVDESMEPRSAESVDVMATVGDGSDYDLGIKIFSRKPRTSEYFGPLNRRSLKYVIYLAPENIIQEVRAKLPASPGLLEKDVMVLPLPSRDNTALENRIRDLTGNRTGRTYFQEVKQGSSPRGEHETHELESFRELISSQGLSPEVAKRLVYQAAVGGLSIESGTHIGQSLGKIKMRRNENLSREAIFLEALGVLQESERSTASGIQEEKKVYLTLDQSENTARLANQIITDILESKRDRLIDIFTSYPNQFVFTAVIGSMGIFAPKQPLPPEGSTTFPLGVIRTTFEQENTYLVETIRELVNITGISTEEWNRLNTLASYTEINNLMHQFFERFEKIGVGVRGNRGIKRLYIPATHISRVMELGTLSESYNRRELKKYVIWDTILNYRTYRHNWAERLSNLGLTRDDVSWALSFTIDRRMTSGPLPEGSHMPFAVYNVNGFRHFCVERMREAASSILDITW